MVTTDAREIDEQDVAVVHDLTRTDRRGSARYSVPHQLVGERVWVRVDGEELVVAHVGRAGAAGGRAVHGRLRRHPGRRLTTPGNPRIDPAHYPERMTDPLHPRPKPASREEAAFLELGPGAERWLILAAASGAERIRTKIRRAAELAALVGSDQVDRALGLAAEAGRFGDGNLESIVDHLRLMGDRTSERIEGSDDTLQPGTSAWELVGR
jgi:hypothetical protein